MIFILKFDPIGFRLLIEYLNSNNIIYNYLVYNYVDIHVIFSNFINIYLFQVG